MRDVRNGSVLANGIRFHYLECGEGPLVLCLHGFPDHARSFRHQMEALAAAGFRAVAPYLRGYAPTERAADGQYQSAALALDTVALIDALGGGRALLFGHDWGAIAAYGAAVLAPEKVARLAVAAVPHGPRLMAAMMSDYDQQRRSWYMFFFQHPLADVAVAANDFAFLDRLWEDWSPGYTPAAEERESLKATFRAPGVLEAALGYYRCTLNPALQSPALAEVQQRLAMAPIEVQTLYFHGVQDGCVGVDLVAGMEASFPRGLTVEIVPAAGHFVHLERPEIVNPILLDFLRAG